MKPTKCPATEKKMRRENKKRGGEKVKRKDIRAFCVSPNFTSDYFASGSGGHKVYNL